MKTLYFIFTFILLATILNSTIINVPVDQLYIEDAITVAVNGDTVLVHPGHYWEAVGFNGKLITVASLYLTTADTSYISSTIIDGDTGGSTVYFNSGEDSTAVLCGFTITNGWDSYGAGITLLNQSSPSLQNLLITENNSTSMGGGISCRDNSNPIIENVTILSNSADTHGGGIYCEESSPTLRHVNISGNTANYGAGICCYNFSSPSIENTFVEYNNSTVAGGGVQITVNSNPSLQNVTISGNTADVKGGGIYLYNNSNPNFNEVTIYDNSAPAGGGMQSRYYCNPIFNNVTIESNVADYGGGFHSYDYSDLLITNSFIINNTANNGPGGGINCYNNSDPDLNNVTISNNSSSSQGGGIYCDDFSHITLQNSTISNNTAAEGGGIYTINSHSDLDYVTMSGNAAIVSDGGGISCHGSGMSLVKVLVNNNSAEQNGGGIYGTEATVLMSRVTISDNNASNLGGGIAVTGTVAGQLSFYTSIHWNNEPEEISVATVPNYINYSDIEGDWTGLGNINNDPLFVSPSNKNYSLLYNSPCIDMGDPTTSLDPDGTRADMGAYYFDQSIDGGPTITAITDVPYDQGRSVIVSWGKSYWDQELTSFPILGYNLWEKYPYELDSDSIITNDIYMAIGKGDTFFQREDTTWVHIDYIAAMQWENYLALSETFFDSTSIGDYISYFFVSAHTSNPSIYFNSSVASGYSIDNIAPDETEVTITRNGNYMNLSWDEVDYGTYQGNVYPEVNGIWYKVYAGDTPDFVCNAINLIDTVTNLNYDYPIGGENKKFFKVVVSDQP